MICPGCYFPRPSSHILDHHHSCNISSHPACCTLPTGRAFFSLYHSCSRYRPSAVSLYLGSFMHALVNVHPVHLYELLLLLQYVLTFMLSHAMSLFCISRLCVLLFSALSSISLTYLTQHTAPRTPLFFTSVILDGEFCYKIGRTQDFHHHPLLIKFGLLPTYDPSISTRVRIRRRFLLTVVFPFVGWQYLGIDNLYGVNDDMGETCCLSEFGGWTTLTFLPRQRTRVILR